MLTHLTQDIYGVVISKESVDYEIIRCQDDYDKKYLKYDSDKYKGYQNYNSIYLGKENFEIIGTASPEEITFNCEDYVEMMFEKSNFSGYKNYLFDDNLFSKEDSFISLIESKGIALQPNEKLLILKKL